MTVTTWIVISYLFVSQVMVNSVYVSSYSVEKKYKIKRLEVEYEYHINRE